MVNSGRASRRMQVMGNGRGLVGHVGAALVAQLADRLGFTDALSAGISHTASVVRRMIRVSC